MSGNLQAYRATGAEGFGDGLGPGATLRRARGLHVTRTLRDALVERARGEFGSGWPLRLFEVSVDGGDVLSEDGVAIRARAYRIERELPLSDALGGRADELGALVDGLRRIRWLRPSGAAGLDARVAELVAEHQAALADYEPTPAAPVRIVHTWHEARDLYGEIDPYERAITTSAAVKAACRVLVGTTWEGAFHLVRPVTVTASFGGAWDGAWRAADENTTHILRGGRQIYPEDPGLALASSVKSAELLALALDAARTSARRGAWEIALDIFTDAPGELPPASEFFEDAARAARKATADRLPVRHAHGPGCAICAAWPAVRDEMVDRFIQHTSQAAGRLAIMASRHAWWQAAYLIREERRLDPFRPLLDLWRLGAWPLGVVAGSYVVLVPEAVH